MSGSPGTARVVVVVVVVGGGAEHARPARCSNAASGYPLFAPAGNSAGSALLLLK